MNQFIIDVVKDLSGLFLFIYLRTEIFFFFFLDNSSVNTSVGREIILTLDGVMPLSYKALCENRNS